MTILKIQVNQELEEYLTVFTQIENPIYLAFFITLVLCITIYFFVKYVLIPQQISHRLEKEILEKRNLQLLASFTSLSPDPLIRLDMNGVIIAANKAAAQLAKNKKVTGRYINEIIGSNLKLKENTDGSPFEGIHTIRKRIYSFYLKKVPAEDMMLLYMRDITDSQEYERKLKEVMTSSQDRLEEERRAIAYELHDGVGQNLSSVKVSLYGILNKYNKTVDQEDVGRPISMLEKAICELKTISYNLKPRVLDEMGLGPAILDLCNGIPKEAGLMISSEIKGKEKRLPSLVEANLYRIIQEAVNNVIKHACATQCLIHLEYNPRSTRLIISDDGKGFDLKDKKVIKTKSLGLFSMKQRVEHLKGKFVIETVPGQGTIIFIDIVHGEDLEHGENQDSHC